ncbi:MAG: acyltransferase family protein [Candidatus Kapaibacterium sp.]
MIPALTGLRAVAAALVFFGHVMEPHRAEASWLVHYGFTGVDIFFALSGYLFMFQYADALLQGSFSWSRYIKRRLIRIYPVTMLVVIVASASRWEYLSWGNIVAHLTLVHGWFVDYRLRLNGPMWSLTIEESYYLLAPFLIFLFTVVHQSCVKRFGMWNRSWTHAGVWVAALIGVWWLSAMLSRGMSTTYQDLLYAVTTVWDDGASTFTIFGRISEFVAGMCAAVFMRGAMLRSRYAGDALVVLAIAGFTGVSAFIEAQGGEMLVGQHKLGMVALKSYAFVGAIAMMGLHAGGMFARLLSHPVSQRLGECSFALYIIQLMPIGNSINAGMDLQAWMEGTGMPWPLAALISYTALNIVAVLLYSTFEKPVRSALRARFA